ncbi:MAG: glycosyltransferase family 4 protein, partial [bacterium]|nr:glycosyltransferase family 4 protein [bacterium]
MRILVLNYELPPLGGGGGLVSQELAEHFATRGHDTHLVTMAFRGLPREEERAGVRITRVPALRAKAATCRTHEMASFVASAFPRLVRLLRSGHYDIIHCHFIIPCGPLAYAATRFARVPYVLTAHGSDVPGYNPDRFTLEHKITPPLLRLMVRKAARITAPSRYLSDLIHTNIGHADVDFIPNGIHMPSKPPPAKQRRILLCGRLLPRKGFQHILAALKGVDTDYEVHVAGDGPFREELESIAAGLHVPVHFHGWLDHDSPELQDLYDTSAILCLPSERENASMALLEGMRAGMAVITSNVTGCPETVG